eukprot:CAMPEP_0197313864 /NCGR_PEP_ID=MMETSP0891-20130614/30873_1 /TAXON_ID=44058 ORGANISM="Aureoumbra lagunensis, Strain CCMP1510" /NCGR_SAMPLE_ID=MMETSP0891 /ASSEMBLY_ACC=CAM_ASM_000534 /LENGTH=769 /DNA_ID=CAMNT_0042801991 /DNA_START=516 /DNA_END=2825 /DNA_ORIENTATION=+
MVQIAAVMECSRIEKDEDRMWSKLITICPKSPTKRDRRIQFCPQEQGDTTNSMQRQLESVPEKNIDIQIQVTHTNHRSWLRCTWKRRQAPPKITHISFWHKSSLRTPSKEKDKTFPNSIIRKSVQADAQSVLFDDLQLKPGYWHIAGILSNGEYTQPLRFEIKNAPPIAFQPTEFHLQCETICENRCYIIASWVGEDSPNHEYEFQAQNTKNNTWTNIPLEISTNYPHTTLPNGKKKFFYKLQNTFTVRPADAPKGILTCRVHCILHSQDRSLPYLDVSDWTQTKFTIPSKTPIIKPQQEQIPQEQAPKMSSNVESSQEETKQSEDQDDEKESDEEIEQDHEKESDAEIEQDHEKESDEKIEEDREKESDAEIEQDQDREKESDEEIEQDQSDENDDWCYECGQFGQLLCCDECNLSFHLKCSGLDEFPPEDEHWACPVCRPATDAAKEKKSHNNNVPVREIKTCSSCGGDDTQVEVIDCAQCKKSFHYTCSGLQRSPSKRIPWSCLECVAKSTINKGSLHSSGIEKKTSSKTKAHRDVLRSEPPLENDAMSDEDKTDVMDEDDDEARSVSANDDTCYKCKRYGNLILCDKCQRSYHYRCAGLKTIPTEKVWFCPICHEEEEATPTKNNTISRTASFSRKSNKKRPKSNGSPSTKKKQKNDHKIPSIKPLEPRDRCWKLFTDGWYSATVIEILLFPESCARVVWDTADERQAIVENVHLDNLFLNIPHSNSDPVHTSTPSRRAQATITEELWRIASAYSADRHIRWGRL